MRSYSEDQWVLRLNATSTEMQNNFGKYLEMVSEGKVITVTRNGKEVARVVPCDYQADFLTDRLRGMLKGDFDYDALKEKEMAGKYEVDD